MHVPAERRRASVALSTERAPNHLLVSAPLRPSNARNHTLSLLSENPSGFPDTILSGAQRDRWVKLDDTNSDIIMNKKKIRITWIFQKVK